MLGEVRGGEAFDLLQALNTGHDGSLSTIHASSAEEALSRFTSCVLQSGIQLPYAAIRSNIAQGLDMVVQITREGGRRVVSEALAVKRYLVADDCYEFETLFERGRC